MFKGPCGLRVVSADCAWGSADFCAVASQGSNTTTNSAMYRSREPKWIPASQIGFAPPRRTAAQAQMQSTGRRSSGWLKPHKQFSVQQYAVCLLPLESYASSYSVARLPIGQIRTRISYVLLSKCKLF